MSPAIEVRDVFRVHATEDGGVAALQGLTLSVAEREVCVVLGPSGSGKTTLLRILAGLDRPSAGTVRIFGTDLPNLPGRSLAAYRSRSLGYADQHYWRALAAELDARDLVGVQLGLAGASRRERRARAEELLERVGLAGRAGAHPRELSGGEQQRVAVCAALAHRPRLFLADEPTGELDAGSARLVYELIGELSREFGCTTVIVSHDPESAAVADRVVRVRDGRVSDEAARADGGRDTIVVGRGGWLRIPEEFLRRAGIQDRARADLTDEGVVVSAPERGRPLPTGPAPVWETESREDTPAVAAEVRSLTRSFDSTTPISGLDAVFPAGRLVAVTGPSGSGKTTLLHLLAGLDLPTSGEVVLLGTPLGGLDRASRAGFRRDHVAFVGQEPGLTPFLTAAENLELALRLRGLSGADAEMRARESLAAVGRAGASGQRVSRLSTGERGRVAVARALAARPALLLADEPTARLDQANAVAIGALFAALARESGTCVICATHDPVVIEQSDEELALAGASHGAPDEVAARS